MENQTATLKFNGDNWVVWKFQTQVILKSRGYFDIVSGTKLRPATDRNEQTKWDSQDAKAQEVIVTRMEQGPLTHILSCETSKDMWFKLKSVYDKESEVSIHLLQQKFFMLDFGSGSVSSFISRLEEIKNKLQQAGEQLSDKMLMTKILMALPEEYKHFRSAWESVPSDKQTLEELTSRLCIEEERNKFAEESTVLVARDKNNSVKGKVKSKCYICQKPGHVARFCFSRKKENVNKENPKENGYSRETKQCTYCRRRGHEVKDCWFRKNKEENRHSSKRTEKDDEKSNETNAFMVFSKNIKNGNDWCLDTGASEHMCWNKDLFQDLIETKMKKQVKVGNGEKLPVEGVGKVILWAFNGKKLIKSTLSNVLYVPDLQFNLFSAGCALDKGYTMFSNNEKCEFVNKNGEIGALATRENKLYRMHFVSENNPEYAANFSILEHSPESVTEKESLKYETEVNDSLISECNTAKITESLSTWHSRLAHQNVNYVRQFLKRNHIDFIEENFLCEQCLKGKQHRLPFEQSKSRASKPLELVHSDVCGPMEQESLGGARYFLLLKDDYTSYRYVYFMKQKSEVKKNIEKFISLAERETGHKMKTLRSDNGLEFINKEVKEILESKGIRHQRSVVYTPQQNGRAERENRTLVEAARTMIQGQKMEKHFWAEAINTATYIMNRIGTSSEKNKAPYELWFQREVNVSIFKSFGSKVSVHVPNEKRLKWDAKNTLGIFLGYGEDIKGYRIYIPDKNKVEFHRDVIFLPENTIEVNKEKENSNDKIYIPNETKNNIDDETEDNNFVNNPIEREINMEEIYESDSSSSYEDADNDQNNRYNLRREIRRPPRFDVYELDMETSFLTFTDDEPQTYDDAMASSDSRKWKEAMDTEISALIENGTWQCVDKVDDMESEIIECKWVFKKKKDESGNVAKYKARLVARGFQQKGMSFSDIYSPVAKLPSIRVFLAVCNKFDMKIHQLDVCSAFLNGDIKENVYITLPKGFKEKEGTVCKLRKSLYGLKSSPKNWNDKFHELMLEMKFIRCEHEYCLYIKVTESCRIYVLIYVDDLLLAGTVEEEVGKVIQSLNKNLKMKNLGQIGHFLGMLISQNLPESKIIINQTNYLRNVLQKFGLLDCKPSKTPMDANFHHDQLKRDKSESLEIEKKCRMAIGCLMYAMLCSRPDLCIAIGILSRYQTCASQDLWKEIKHVLRYVQGTLGMSLVYYKNESENIITGFSDSDWAGDCIDRKSTSGYIFKVFNCTVSWASRKQSTVSLSSTEAEYVALSLCVSEACWLRYLFYDLKIIQDFQRVTVFADNQSAIKVCKNPEFHKRLKHVDIRFHFVRDKIKQNVVMLKYISTTEQQADMFTKPLGFPQFKKLRDMLGLE